MRYTNHEAAVASLTDGFRVWKLGRKVVAHDGEGLMLLLRGRPGEQYWSTMTELTGDRPVNPGATLIWEGEQPAPKPVAVEDLPVCAHGAHSCDECPGFHSAECPCAECENDRAYEAYARKCECPVCGDTEMTSVIEGPPSMLGEGRYDPETLILACGHHLSWSPLDGRELVYDGQGTLVHQGAPTGADLT